MLKGGFGPNHPEVIAQQQKIDQIKRSMQELPALRHDPGRAPNPGPDPGKDPGQVGASSAAPRRRTSADKEGQAPAS